jgi:hypothetical protein
MKLSAPRLSCGRWADQGQMLAMKVNLSEGEE